MHFTTLLIEPPGIDSQLLQVMLAPEKFRVDSVECGSDAWNLIIRNDPPDLVIIDTDLPLSGRIRIGATQLLELMSTQPRWQQIPRLVLTSDDSSDILRHIKDPHICAAILKPYDPIRFMQEVFNCLSRYLQRHIEEVNRQHLQLGTQVKRVAATCRLQTAHDINGSLRAIPAAMEKHFEFEEAFMSRHNYPDFMAHYQGHLQIRTKVNALIEETCAGEPSRFAEKIEQLGKNILDGVDDDKRYIDFLYGLIDSLTLKKR